MSVPVNISLQLSAKFHSPENRILFWCVGGIVKSQGGEKTRQSGALQCCVCFGRGGRLKITHDHPIPLDGIPTIDDIMKWKLRVHKIIKLFFGA